MFVAESKEKMHHVVGKLNLKQCQSCEANAMMRPTTGKTTTITILCNVLGSGKVVKAFGAGYTVFALFLSLSRIFGSTIF